MEAYLAYSNLEGMMELTENMFKHIAQSVFGKYTFIWGENEINLNTVCIVCIENAEF